MKCFFSTYDSPLPIDECLDADLGDISYSESERYKNDSRRTGRFCNASPEALTFPAFVWPLSSTSKLFIFEENKTKQKTN